MANLKRLTQEELNDWKQRTKTTLPKGVLQSKARKNTEFVLKLLRATNPYF